MSFKLDLDALDEIEESKRSGSGDYPQVHPYKLNVKESYSVIPMPPTKAMVENLFDITGHPFNFKLIQIKSIPDAHLKGWLTLSDTFGEISILSRVFDYVIKYKKKFPVQAELIANIQKNKYSSKTNYRFRQESIIYPVLKVTTEIKGNNGFHVKGIDRPEGSILVLANSKNQGDDFWLEIRNKRHLGHNLISIFEEGSVPTPVIEIEKSLVKREGKDGFEYVVSSSGEKGYYEIPKEYLTTMEFERNGQKGEVTITNDEVFECPYDAYLDSVVSEEDLTQVVNDYLFEGEEVDLERFLERGELYDLDGELLFSDEVEEEPKKSKKVAAKKKATSKKSTAKKKKTIVEEVEEDDEEENLFDEDDDFEEELEEVDED